MEYTTPEHLEVSVEHLRRNLPEIMAKVEGGGATVTLTRYNRPVGRIVPVESDGGKSCKPPEK